ncbi:putative bifunctional inhibitor/plant lipid transfer protein/seed storage helical [Helianthus debilis subsp. tardiflorus]
MAKVEPFAFILIAIVAFSKMSAYRTSTIEDIGHEMQIEISGASQNQCPHVQENSCDQYFRWLIKNDIQNCCVFLNKVSKQCQCSVIQQTHDKHQPKAGGTAKKRLHDAAQSLPKDCKLSLKDCQIAGPKD